MSLRREPDEVWVHATHHEQDEPGRTEWTRWSVPEEDALHLVPALPDRPIVVSPEQQFFLPPQGRARVFVRVPLFVRLMRVFPSGGETHIDQFPTLVLSDTWWGTFTEGELAYWVGTRARRAVSPEIFEPHLAICSFVLSNESDQALPVDRFAVRTSHLSLFDAGAATWTDEVQVRYQGPQEGSEIHYTGDVPREAGAMSPLAPPQEPPPRGLHARTFGRLRALSGHS